MTAPSWLARLHQGAAAASAQGAGEGGHGVAPGRSLELGGEIGELLDEPGVERLPGGVWLGAGVPGAAGRGGHRPGHLGEEALQEGFAQDLPDPMPVIGIAGGREGVELVLGGEPHPEPHQLQDGQGLLIALTRGGGGEGAAGGQDKDAGKQQGGEAMGHGFILSWASTDDDLSLIRIRRG